MAVTKAKALTTMATAPDMKEAAMVAEGREAAAVEVVAETETAEAEEEVVVTKTEMVAVAIKETEKVAVAIKETEEAAIEAPTRLKEKVAGTKTRTEIEIIEEETEKVDFAVVEEAEVAEATKATEMADIKEVAAVVLVTNQANHSLLCQPTQRKLESRNRASLQTSSK